MKLDLLLQSLDITMKDKYQSLVINGLSFDSSKVDKNFIFIAIAGTNTDGHLYINDAIKNGAAAIIGEHDIEDLEVPYFKVPNSRKALAILARTFHHNPTQNKIMIGITGTNGKTTTSYMLKHILESQGISCALFGSVSTVINGIENSSSHTTLDPLTFNQLLSFSHDKVVIMEVSSHGLTQYRVEGIEFDYCIFTNLEPEHLDYHLNMESYYLAKQTLFDHLKSDGVAIVNSTTEWGERLSSYVLSRNNHVIQVSGKESAYSISGNELLSPSNSESFLLTTCMKGQHNIENAALAFLTSISLGIASTSIIEALSNFNGVPGRFQLFSHPSGATFVIDYAHTSNAFYHILETVHSYKPRKIIHIFGFRGNRDPQKRKNMIDVSLKNCDESILTFDDLNGVSIDNMLKELTELNLQDKCLVIPDRTQAIQYAWKQAQDQDWIVITGKGIEDYRQPFSLPTTSDMETLHYLNHTLSFQKEH
ncbi:UDP-N-acetylmuramoyl-L-alanyl-D-glutamate--2,6-diaminopimelate ligase [Psychrobacillus sp. FJAT-51614]|uniref:UDP-N-acetylmuramoyl-L-alanyl-D-glutamate--2, 6-diaminopimelate ligase n=1 Tax=Psychrobacillus mangrovi TaxID=3117745 RepID=A0ABU8F730_9BACI